MNFLRLHSKCPPKTHRRPFPWSTPPTASATASWNCPPSSSTITLSRPPPSSNPTVDSMLTDRWSISSSSADGLARLRAAGKTYALRQKNTSNALVLLQAASSSSSPTDDGLKPTVWAIATVHETVELIEEKEETASQAAKPAAAPARGKWHEKFGKTR